MSGRDDFRHAGYLSGDHHDKPVDLAAVQADDALLDLLGSGDTPVDTGDELTRVLAAWRREVRGEPVSELVDTDTALAVLHAARRPVRRRNPVFGSIAAAAAVLVIAFSGVGLFAKSAQPNDQLWGVAQVLYPDYARSVETAAAVKTELAVADKALKEGNTQKAKESLQRVQQQLPVIAEAEGRADLATLHRELEQKLIESPETGSANAPSATIPAEGRIPGSFTPPSSEKSSTSSEPTVTSAPEQPDEPARPIPGRNPSGFCSGSNPPAGCPRTGSSTVPGGGSSGGGGTDDSGDSSRSSVNSGSGAPASEGPAGGARGGAGSDSPPEPGSPPGGEMPPGAQGSPGASGAPGASGTPAAPGPGDDPPSADDFMPPLVHAVHPVAAVQAAEPAGG